MSKIKKYLPIYLFALFIFLLSLININSYFFHQDKKVLGANTINLDGVFWYDFLQKNPAYIPGWLEIGRPDKAKKIDPNYF